MKIIELMEKLNDILTAQGNLEIVAPMGEDRGMGPSYVSVQKVSVETDPNNESEVYLG